MFFVIFISSVVTLNIAFTAVLLKDCWDHRKEIKEEPGNPIVIGIYCMVVQFLSALGVSDFAIHMIFWRALKWVPDKKLPGTMFCSCVIPQAFMAVAYVTMISVDIQTLVVSIVFSLAGCLVGVKVVSGLSDRAISKTICLALFVSSIVMILGLLDLIPMTGTGTALRSWKQVVNAVINFVLAAVCMAGFPITALKIAITSSLGISPQACYPMATSTTSLTMPFGGISFIRHGAYYRKITLISTVTGSIGGLIAVFAVSQMDTTILRWGIAILALQAGCSSLKKILKEKES